MFGCRRAVIAATLTLGSFVVLATTGCNDDEKSCQTAADCPNGQVCTNGICLRTGTDAPSDDAIADTGPAPDTWDDRDTGPDTVPDSRPDDTGPADTRDTARPDPDIVSPDAGNRGPQIRVVPSNELDFGTITVPSTQTEKVVVRNVGDATLSVKDAGLIQTPSDGFKVSKVSRLPRNLSPGQTLSFQLTFDPNQQARYENGFFIESNDRDSSDRRIELELGGTAFNKVGQPCLYSTPDTLDFGVVMPGNTGTQAVTIGNCSVGSKVTVTSYNFLSNPNGVFSIASSSPQPPFQVGVNKTKKVRIEFTPQSKRSLSGQISIRSDETTGGGDYVDLAASGGGCAEAKARGNVPNVKFDRLREGTVAAEPGLSVALNGDESTSPSGKLNYTWSLTQKPSGSNASLTSTSSSNTTLTPKTPGVYTARLEVTNPVSGKKGCVVDSVDVVALPKSAELTVAASWKADHNMDLHVVRSNANGTFPNFRDRDDDTYPEQPSQNWGDSGKRTDDAFHQGDGGVGNTSGSTGERILVSSLEKNRDYRVALHFRDSDGFRPARFQSSGEITINGSSQSLSHRWTIRDRNKFWIVYEIDGKTGKVTTVDRER